MMVISDYSLGWIVPRIEIEGSNLADVDNGYQAKAFHTEFFNTFPSKQ